MATAKQVAILGLWHTDNRPDNRLCLVCGDPAASRDLVRAVQYAREHWTPWIGPMFVWNLPDSQWTPDNEEFWWGIADPFWWDRGAIDLGEWPGGAIRPAYTALEQMDKP